MIVLVHHFAVGIAGAVSDPRTVAGKKDRFERGHDTAGGNENFQGSDLSH